jgi:metal-sulfur cluster biosynthetic enzyme
MVFYCFCPFHMAWKLFLLTYAFLETSMGCPCTELITADIRARLLQIEGVDEVEIVESFDEWKREHMSRRGIRKLRALGVG